MENGSDNKRVEWPGAVLALGFFAFILFLLWTVLEVLPWQ